MCNVVRLSRARTFQYWNQTPIYLRLIQLEFVCIGLVQCSSSCVTRRFQRNWNDHTYAHRECDMCNYVSLGWWIVASNRIDANVFSSSFVVLLTFWFINHHHRHPGSIISIRNWFNGTFTVCVCIHVSVHWRTWIVVAVALPKSHFHLLRFDSQFNFCELIAIEDGIGLCLGLIQIGYVCAVTGAFLFSPNSKKSRKFPANIQCHTHRVQTSQIYLVNWTWWSRQ